MIFNLFILIYLKIHTIMMRCRVINCLSHNEKNKKISLFTLPKNPNIRKEWTNVLSEVNGKDILSTSRVCELHFNPCDMCVLT